MTTPLRRPAVRAVGLATAIVAVAALLLGLMAGALGNEAPPASTGPGAAAPAAAEGSAAPTGLPGSDPTSPAPPEAASSPGGPPGAPGQYVVDEGDTLASIADRNDVPAELIAQDSGIADPDRLAVGQVLTISTPPRNVVVVVPGSSLGDYARELSTTVDQLLALNPQIQDPDVVLAGSGLRIAGS